MARVAAAAFARQNLLELDWLWRAVEAAAIQTREKAITICKDCFRCTGRGRFDIQSWWEVPSIAHFCSLFRASFDLLDFDIEELEEALLTDGTEECASSLLTELIVRLLKGCLDTTDITASNYQMFLRRLFRQKCQETGHSNIFNADIDFQFLPLRRKVQILHELCNFRLGAEDVFDSLKNLEAESLRVEPLGWDSNSSAYWYFYGTRLYREDFIVKPKGKKRKGKDEKKSKNNEDETEEKTERIWQVVCFTEDDWLHLTEKFKNSTNEAEKELYLALSRNFLPEIPRLFQEKERLRRKRLLESLPRRTSSRVQNKKQKEGEEESQAEEETQNEAEDSSSSTSKRDNEISDREHRARQRELNRSKSRSSQGGDSRSPSRDPVAEKRKKRERRSRRRRRSGGDKVDAEDEDEATASAAAAATTAEPRPSAGRQTNNSLAWATGKIVIPERREHPNRKKLKTSQIFGLMEEAVKTDMYKVLDQLKAHEDAWPFMDPVEEDDAPNYYSVIRRPMDLQRMEDRLDQGYYTDFSMFQSDFSLIVKNCRLYNGQDNKFTEMVDNLEAAFNRLTQRYFECLLSSDDEIAIDYSFQNPSPRKHSEKGKKSENDQGVKKRKRVLSTDDERVNDTLKPEDDECCTSEKRMKLSDAENENEPSEFSKSILKKRKKKLKSSKKKHKDKHSKKNKEKRKHSKHTGKKNKKDKKLHRSSDNRAEMGTSHAEIKNEDWGNSSEGVFYKDKYDQIKERRRGTFKTSSSAENISDSHKSSSKNKHNLLLSDKSKNAKLKETIDKLKAKSEKSVDNSDIFDHYLKSNSKKSKHDISKMKSRKMSESHSKSHKSKADEYEFLDDYESDKRKNKDLKQKGKGKSHSGPSNRNESASEALEEAAKDIWKLLEDPPKNIGYISTSNSPSQISDDFRFGSKFDDGSNSNQSERDKNLGEKKMGRKKSNNKDSVPKISSRKKEVQRTIERLQPGKAKGNLISSIPSTSKAEDSSASNGSVNKVKEVKVPLLIAEETDGPKLSLGTVLDSGFGIEKQHNFTTESAIDNTEKAEVVDTENTIADDADANDDTEEVSEIAEKDDFDDAKEAEKKPPNPPIASQEKATPNLSAWFKAFGAPKSGGTSKKKSEEGDQEDANKTSDNAAEKNSTCENFDGGESPLPGFAPGGRTRRTSTGSSVSERSSFSQELDSPRHQPSHTSPLLRSPASPRIIEEHQKPVYPAINGTVRVGFYQDTASVKSSPDKSCSPREAPQSPYAAYSQHVYATGEPHPGKSPVIGFAQSYCESAKSGQKRSQEDRSAFGSDSAAACKPPVSPGGASFSPTHSPFSQHSQHSPYSQVPAPQYEQRPVEKSTFPVKKRTYNRIAPATSAADDSMTSNELDLSNHTASFESRIVPNISSNYLHCSTSVITTNLRMPYSGSQAGVEATPSPGYGQKLGPREVYTEPDTMKTPYDFSPMSRLNVPNLSVKDAPNSKSHMSVDNQNKSSGMANMGYAESVSMDTLTTSKADASLTKAHTSYDLYQGYSALNTSLKSSTEPAELTTGYHHDKYNAGVQYHSLALDSARRPAEDSMMENYKKAKQSYSESVNLSRIENYNKNLLPHPSDWKIDSVNKNSEPISYSNYRQLIDEHNKKMNIDNMGYGSACEANDNLQKLSSELRVPTISEHQQAAAAQDYLARTKNAMSLHGNKSEVMFGANAQLGSGGGMSAYKMDSMSAAVDHTRNISTLMDRLKEDGMLSSFQTGAMSYDKSNHLAAQLYTKSVQNMHGASNDAQQMFAFGGRDSIYNLSNMQANMHHHGLPEPPPPVQQEPEKKPRPRKKKNQVEVAAAAAASSPGQQAYLHPHHHHHHHQSAKSDAKAASVPGSAFNFGEGQPNYLDLRNPYVAANYMAAAAAVAAAEDNKSQKGAEERLGADSAYGRLLAHHHHQARPTAYPFLGALDPSSSLYPPPPAASSFLQRHQEALFRSPGARIMGIFPTYQNALGGARPPPYDSIDRDSWL